MELKKSLSLTLSYFDLFDYPLKKEEIWQWLWSETGSSLAREEVEKELLSGQREGWIAEQEGFYFLPGREKIVGWREEREKISWKKIKKAQRVARLLGLIFGVKMIAVCSNLGYLNADEEADIDFFIVSEVDRIWSVRFWSVFWMKILGQRPSPGKTKNKICLSYFVTEDNLNLKSTETGEPDRHLIYLLSQYLPIYSEDNLWQRFVAANYWIKRYLPNFQYGSAAERFLIKPKYLRWKRLLVGLAGKRMERLLERVQRQKMAGELKALMNDGQKKVIINNKMLKLHSNDKREEINQKISKSQIPISPPASPCKAWRAGK